MLSWVPRTHWIVLRTNWIMLRTHLLCASMIDKLVWLIKLELGLQCNHRKISVDAPASKSSLTFFSKIVLRFCNFQLTFCPIKIPFFSLIVLSSLNFNSQTFNRSTVRPNEKCMKYPCSSGFRYTLPKKKKSLHSMQEDSTPKNWKCCLGGNYEILKSENLPVHEKHCLLVREKFARLSPEEWNCISQQSLRWLQINDMLEKTRSMLNICSSCPST